MADRGSVRGLDYGYCNGTWHHCNDIYVGATGTIVENKCATILTSMKTVPEIQNGILQHPKSYLKTGYRSNIR